MRVRVLTVSDRASAGEYEDRSGPLLAELLEPLGTVEGPLVVPDGPSELGAAVAQAVADGVDLLVTTGGTGVGPRDLTPDVVEPLLERSLPGVAEAIRAAGTVPTAALSRGVAGLIGTTFVVTLPGSPGGVRDGAAVLLPLAQHVNDQVRGHDH